MRTKLSCGIGLLAAIVAGAGSAMAADLPVKAPPAPVMPAYVSDWAGFYIGINGGGGWGHTTFDFTPALNTTASGGVIGGHAGYNWQYGSVVAGLEADFDGADINKTILGVEQKTDELASARARLGYLFVPNLLAYGTAGAGWGHTEISTPGFLSDEVNQFGWVAGAGLEYKLVDHVLLRAEYLHYGFAKTEAPNVVGDNFKENIDVVRGGLSWKF
ncbi:MAG TPA: outer membrane protein [Xanthobacteraceae bacterium]|jgi:outer membrane immunogenic protein|nr:outer membrane protein [Xanthobacteraceae bacterium]